MRRVNMRPHVQHAAECLEAGVNEFFQQFGHRCAREISMQPWLVISLARHFKPSLVVAELNVRARDIAFESGTERRDGAASFDIAITQSEIDLRLWKSRTPGWKHGNCSKDQTYETLSDVLVLAEFKVVGSSTGGNNSLRQDLRKLRGAMTFLAERGHDALPACYLVLLDPDRRADITTLHEETLDDWPERAPLPRILLGPQ